MSRLSGSFSRHCLRSSVFSLQPQSPRRQLSTSSARSASKPTPTPRQKRNPHISNDPRYADIQKITEHDPQNWLYPWAIFDEMNRSGTTPSESYNYLLYSLRHSNSKQTWKVLEEMKRHKIPISTDNLAQLISRAVLNNNLELALRHLHTLRSQTAPLDIPLEPIQSIIELAAKQSHSRLAIDIAVWWEGSGDAQLPKSVWTLCLASAASGLYEEGIELAWDKILSFPDTSLTEGLLTIVLQATKRLELPELSEEIELALRAQQEMNAPVAFKK